MLQWNYAAGAGTKPEGRLMPTYLPTCRTHTVVNELVIVRLLYHYASVPHAAGLNEIKIIVLSERLG